jgi:hypothetical protein
MKNSPKILLRLQVPRLNTRGPMAFEQVLASLHGLLTKNAQKTGNETISFEIVKISGKIYFYIVAPKHLKTLISSQIYAQYPQVEIEEVPEYFTKKLVQNRNVLVATMRPTGAWVFPFKRYPQFEDKLNQTFEDPIGPITSAISHLYDKDDTCALQFSITPCPSRWNKMAQRNLRFFFGNGPWKWNWFQMWYNWARLSTNKNERIHRFLIWGFIQTFLGWTGKAKVNLSGNDPIEDDNDESQFDRDEQTSGRHERESVYSACFDKLSRLNFSTNIRILYIHSDPDPLHAEAKIREISGTLQQFSQPKMNSLGLATLAREIKSEQFKNFIHRRQKKPFPLSQEELATMVHLPTETVTSPGVAWVDSVKIEPPSHLPSDKETDATLIGKTNFRTLTQKYGIRPVDRRRHVYIIGKTGMGKSTLLENMIRADIEAGKGVGVIDPHGDLAEAVLRFTPKKRTNDVIIFDPSDRGFPLAFNMLEGKNPEQRGLIASGLVGVIKKLNEDSWGPRLEHFLRNTVLALVEAPDTTMLGITRMLVDKIYREKILHYVTDPMVKSFWRTEFDAMAPAKLTEAVGPIQNKVGQFLSTPIIRNIVGQPKSTLDLRFAMDSGKIVVVNLSKGKIGEDNATMLGSMLITKFQIDAMSRADIAEKDRRDFSLFVDEFQNFATDSFATILSEARKYKLALTMANQYIAQMSEEVAAAVFGNVGSLISFQVGIDDAKVLAEQFDEERIEPIHLASLPKYKVYNRIMVDGLTTPVFSGDTLPPPDNSDEEDPEVRAQKIVNFSRQRYAKPRESVENKIARWSRDEKEKKATQKSATKEENTTSQKNKPEKQKNTDKKLPAKKHK